MTGETIMKSILHTKYGPPELLRLEEVEKPLPKDNEVLVRICATKVTSADCNARRNFRSLTGTLKKDIKREM